MMEPCRCFPVVIYVKFKISSCFDNNKRSVGLLKNTCVGLGINGGTSRNPLNNLFTAATGHLSALNFPSVPKLLPVNQINGDRKTSNNGCGNSGDPLMPECFEYARHRYNKKDV
jgi:hypothetical protein